MSLLTVLVTNLHPIESPISDEANSWSTNNDCVTLRQLLADRQQRPDSPVAGTGHIAETFRRHLRAVTPVDIRL